jgi:hypothetical protein
LLVRRKRIKTKFDMKRKKKKRKKERKMQPKAKEVGSRN